MGGSGRGTGETAESELPRIELVREGALRIGPLTVDPPARSVRHADGREAVLEPRQMQMLVALLRADGGVLSREQIIEACWDGRIVGDDSISSVIYRLRRDLKDLAEGLFTIDTVTKVGFRIVRHDLPEGGEESVVAVPPSLAKRLRQVPSLVWAAAAVLAVGLGGGLAAWNVAPSGPTYSLTLAPFRADAGAAAFDEELASALTELEVPTSGGATGLRLEGGVQNRSGVTRINARLVDIANRQVLWSGAREIPSIDPRELVVAANLLGSVVDCTLAGANDAVQALPPAIFSLHARACEMIIVGPPPQGVPVARELTRRAPDFAAGWFALAHLTALLGQSERDENNAYRRESLAAAEKLIGLRPQLQEGYAYKALMMPGLPALPREQLLRRAESLKPLQVDVASAFLGDFLLQVGRFEEAYALHQRTAERDSQQIVPQMRLFQSATLTDRDEQVDHVLARIERIEPRDGRGRRSIVWRRAVWRGDWAAAERLARYEQGREQEAGAATYRALDSGDQPAKDAAAAKVLALPATCCVYSRIEMLTLLGRQSQALALLEQFAPMAAPGRRPGFASFYLWDPAVRSLWRDPGIEPFLQRHGWIAYWRSSHSRPDICGEPAPPRFCGRLAS